jgi:hypothetical protein
MSRITTVLIAASLVAAGAASALSIGFHDAPRGEGGRSYEWSAQESFSADTRRAREQATPPARDTTPFGRVALESLT